MQQGQDSCQTTPRPASRNGFTLVELVVTLIVLGIVAATLLPRFADKDTFERRGFHDQLTAALQFARKVAVAQRRHVCVRYSGGNFSLSVDLRQPEAGASFCDGGTGHEADLRLPATDGKCSASNQVCAPDSVTSLDSVSGTLVFDALGRSSTAATFAVNGQPEIRVEAETGYVH